MPLLVTGAAGANGDGLGALLAFDSEGGFLGRLSDDSRVVDPRGLAVNRSEGFLLLDSGSDRVLMVFGSQLDAAGELFLPASIVPFPSGFAFGHDGIFFLGSGIGPNGVGDNAIVAFDPGECTLPISLVSDPELTPLDLTIAPNGNIVVSSEQPLGARDAVTSVREYDARSGPLVRIFSAAGLADFRRLRGLPFGPDGHLYCVARDEVVTFDVRSGKCLGPRRDFRASRPSDRVFPLSICRAREPKMSNGRMQE